MNVWRSTPLRWRRVTLYVALVLIGAGGIVRLEVTVAELHDLVRREAAEERVEEARDCVSQHARYEQVRQVIEDATVAGAMTGVLAVATVAEAAPEQLAAAQAVITEQTEEAVAPILAGYRPPSCDVDAARDVVAEG